LTLIGDKVMFSKTVILGNRLNCWKTIPIFSLVLKISFCLSVGPSLGSHHRLHKYPSLTFANTHRPKSYHLHLASTDLARDDGLYACDSLAELNHSFLFFDPSLRPLARFLRAFALVHSKTIGYAVAITHVLTVQPFRGRNNGTTMLVGFHRDGFLFADDITLLLFLVLLVPHQSQQSFVPSQDFVPKILLSGYL